MLPKAQVPSPSRCYSFGYTLLDGKFLHREVDMYAAAPPFLRVQDWWFTHLISRVSAFVPMTLDNPLALPYGLHEWL